MSLWKYYRETINGRRKNMLKSLLLLLTTLLSVHAVTFSVVARSQVSRFNDQINDDYSVNLKQVCISIHSSDSDTVKDLLVDAEIKLSRGGHYGLIGRNGVGKSVLMQSLASGSLFSVETRDAVRIMIIRQSIDGHDSDDNPATWTVYNELKRKPFGIVESGQMSELERWQVKAAQQSGLRGLRARLMANKLESAASDDEIQVLDSDFVNDVEKETEDIDDEFADMLQPEELRKLLKQFQIPGDLNVFLSRPYSELSGGWRMRIQLMKVLIYQPDLLLLDEPTNHLDIKGIHWLQRILKQKFEDTTILFVSHNKGFLNAVADNMILFKNRRLEYFKGNYDTLLLSQEEKQLHNERMQEILDRKKSQMESSIKKNLQAAHKYGDDKRLKQAASKKHKLETRLGVEVNSKGHRFKLNRDRIGYFHSNRGEVEHIQGESHQSRLLFNIPVPRMPRGTSELLQVEGVSFRRLGPDGKVIFELKNITFNVCAGQKIAILGSNGEGKSTLLNLIANSWQPTRGHINRKSAKLGYFQQNAVADMAKDTERTPLDRLKQQYPDAK